MNSASEELARVAEEQERNEKKAQKDEIISTFKSFRFESKSLPEKIEFIKRTYGVEILTEELKFRTGVGKVIIQGKDGHIKETDGLVPMCDKEWLAELILARMAQQVACPACGGFGCAACVNTGKNRIYH